jgi:hypothetical protein
MFIESKDEETKGRASDADGNSACYLMMRRTGSAKRDQRSKCRWGLPTINVIVDHFCSRLRSTFITREQIPPNTFLSHANSQAATTYTPHLPVPIQHHRWLHLAVSVSARLRSRWLLASCSSKHAPSISSAYSSFPHVGCTHLTLVPKPLPRRNKTLARELLLQCCSEVDVKQPVTS